MVEKEKNNKNKQHEFTCKNHEHTHAHEKNFSINDQISNEKKLYKSVCKNHNHDHEHEENLENNEKKLYEGVCRNHNHDQEHEENFNINDQENNEKKHSHEEHQASLINELICHLPWATFSVGFGFILLSIVHFAGLSVGEQASIGGYNILFHSFHFLHIVYAVVGTLVTFSRFSTKLLSGIILGIISPSFFCTMSDIALPTLAGNILGAKMEMHVCFFSELHNILPLLFIGLVTGIALSYHYKSSLKVFSLGSHFVHILISSMAALFYMASHGFAEWYESMGILFIFMIIAIIIPCTLSDIVVPWYFAKRKNLENK